MLKRDVKLLYRRALSPVVLPLEALLALMGQAEGRRVAAMPAETPIEQAEFRITSQFGEDGIIQFLISHATVSDKTFVEIGVEDYAQSNTRFLLQNNRWRGLIVDASDSHERFIKYSGLRSEYGIVARTAYITAENVNEVLANNGFVGALGLLSIDIDGMDYWILRASTIVEPAILIVEYNSLFGPEAAIAVPYSPKFNRFEAHFSGLYFGASLAAINDAASERGYALVGSNSAGNNAFFVRRDCLAGVSAPTVLQAWRESTFSESRSPSGKHSYLINRQEKLSLIGDCVVLDTNSQELVTVAQALGL